MAKRYMIFVEGRDAPNKVYNTVNSAWREMRRLANLNEGKDIYIFHLVKRMKKEPGEQHATSIGSHFPDDVPGNMVNKSQLIRGKELNSRQKANAT